MRNVPTIFFYTIIGLALFGIVFQLMTNPSELFGSLLTTILVAVAFGFAIYFLFIRPKTNGDQVKKYKQAVRQSKKKYGGSDSHMSQTRSPGTPPSKIRKKASHLRVIEGNKSKKNNRAHL